MMVNDAYAAAEGKLVLTLERDGTQLVRSDVPFAVAALGQQTYVFDFQAPPTTGSCILKAAAYASGQAEPTVSRRKVTIQAAAH